MPIQIKTKPTPTKFRRSVLSFTVDHPYTDGEGNRVPPVVIAEIKHQTRNDAGEPSYWTEAVGWGDLAPASKQALITALRTVIAAHAQELSLIVEDA